MNLFKKHPFAVEAFFERSDVLAFAVPKEELEPLIPECLSLDTFEDKWVFIAVAMVQTKGLRPKGFPKFMGNDFFLSGYRIFVRYRNNAGKIMRGLYILKSETDKAKMVLGGNTFTHYKYSKIKVIREENGITTRISSPTTGMNILFEEPEGDVPLPEGSPFPDWKQARKFAGPLPFTFTYNKPKREVTIIQGVRQNWKPKPLRVLEYDIPFVNGLNLEGVILANAFSIQNIPYWWKKGQYEIWEG